MEAGKAGGNRARRLPLPGTAARRRGASRWIISCPIAAGGEPYDLDELPRRYAGPVTSTRRRGIMGGVPHVPDPAWKRLVDELLT